MEKETAEVLDSEGWLHTGDLGRIDSDGFLFLCGRLKNMILSSSGQNIYPEEIELKINYMPFVAESLVLDAGQGKLVAFVYPDYDKMKAENISEEQLAEIMREHEYTLYLYGKSDSDEILFESSIDAGLIKPGSVGKNILENKILLKEK